MKRIFPRLYRAGIVVALAASLVCSNASSAHGVPHGTSVGRPQAHGRTAIGASHSDSSLKPTWDCGKPKVKPDITSSVDLSDLKKHSYAKIAGSGDSKHVTVAFDGKVAVHMHIQVTGNVGCTASTKITVPLPGPLELQVGPDFRFDSTGTVAGDFTWSPTLDYGFTLSGTKVTDLSHKITK